MQRRAVVAKTAIGSLAIGRGHPCEIVSAIPCPGPINLQRILVDSRSPAAVQLIYIRRHRLDLILCRSRPSSSL